MTGRCSCDILDKVALDIHNIVPKSLQVKVRITIHLPTT